VQSGTLFAGVHSNTCRIALMALGECSQNSVRCAIGFGSVTVLCVDCENSFTTKRSLIDTYRPTSVLTQEELVALCKNTVTNADSQKKRTTLALKQQGIISSAALFSALFRFCNWRLSVRNKALATQAKHSSQTLRFYYTLPNRLRASSHKPPG
jgi:hypothetical protein